MGATKTKSEAMKTPKEAGGEMTDEWVSVKKRLPENTHDVYAINHNGKPFIAFFDGSIWSSYKDCCGYYSEVERITHWRPLLPLPKDE